MDSNTRDLLVRGIAAAKANQPDEARFYFNWLLRLEPPHDDEIEALYWLTEVCANPQEQRDSLEQILAIDPAEPRARRKLAILDGKLNPEDIIDPDRLISPAPSTPQAAQADRFICPNCGGRMTFTPDGQSLTCEYCEARQGLQHPAQDGSLRGGADFIVAMATGLGHLRPVTTHAFTCQGCGAAFILPPERMTLTCPYCSSAHVIKQPETRQLAAPDGIIPFRVSELQAQRALKRWLEDSACEPPVQVSAVQGIYLPVWSFNLSGQIPWRGLESDGDRWLPVSGLKLVDRQNYPISASRRLPVTFHPALLDYDLSALVDYDDQYLADWLAETYQIPIGEASLDARQRVLEEQRQQILDGSLRPVKDLALNSTDMIVESFRLLLLPAWLSTYSSAGKRFAVLINGQTGAAHGERPERGVRQWFKKLTGR